MGRPLAYFGLGRLVLQNVPMLLKKTVFEPDKRSVVIQAAGLPIPVKRPWAIT